MKNPYINDFAEKWLQAMESGVYEQGTGCLCRDNRFCCLGVAEDLAGSPYTIMDLDGEGLRFYSTRRMDSDNTSAYLTTHTMHKLNLKSAFGDCDIPFNIGAATYSTLASANDDGCSFKEIAAAIRENPEHFFNPQRNLNHEKSIY